MRLDINARVKQEIAYASGGNDGSTNMTFKSLVYLLLMELFLSLSPLPHTFHFSLSKMLVIRYFHMPGSWFLRATTFHTGQFLPL